MPMPKKIQETKEALKIRFFNNPIMETLKKLYPDRDYDLQFELMVDWFMTTKNRFPMTISAFTNWLSKTKPDEVMQNERRRGASSQETKQKYAEMAATPRASEDKLREMRQKMVQIGRQKSEEVKTTSKEEINRTYITVMIVLKSGDHIKGTNDLYDELNRNPTKKFKNKDGIVFCGNDVVKYIPIDDYKENAK